MSIVEAGMPQMGDLLKIGQIDAVTPIEPILSRIVASGAASPTRVDFFSEVNPDVHRLVLDDDARLGDEA